MQQVERVFALLFIFFITTVAWFGLSAMMTARAEQQESELSNAVAELWGSTLEQNAPVHPASEEHQQEAQDLGTHEQAIDWMSSARREEALALDADNFWYRT